MGWGLLGGLLITENPQFLLDPLGKQKRLPHPWLETSLPACGMWPRRQNDS